MEEERPPEIGPGGRSSCEFRCEFLAITQRFQLPRYDSDCPEHRVSTTFRRTSVPLVTASGPGGRGFKSTRPDSLNSTPAAPCGALLSGPRQHAALLAAGDCQFQSVHYVECLVRRDRQLGPPQYRVANILVVVREARGDGRNRPSFLGRRQ